MSKYNVFEKKKLSLIDTIALPLKYSPVNTIFIALVSLLSGIVPTLSLLATSQFINASIVYYNESVGKYRIIISVTGMILCALYFSLVPLLTDYLNTKLKNRLKETYLLDLMARVASLKYDYMEDESSLDLISRISNQGENHCVDAYGKVLGALSLIVKILGIMAVLLFKVPWATLAIALIAIPAFMIAIKGGKEHYDANRACEKYNRRVDDLSQVLTGRTSAKERDLFDYSSKINDLWHDQYDQSRKIKFKASLKWLKGSEIGGTFTSLLISVIILILVLPLKNGHLSIGLFISIINSVMALIPDLAWQLPKYAEAIAQAKEFLEDFTVLLGFDFKQAYLCQASSETCSIDRIEFIGVSFQYPASDRYILKNLNLVIEGGKHHALVGVNGCGKTTITKLLTGLYEDFEGEILINNRSIKAYKQEELKSMFALVYQDFSRYGISIKDNICLGRDCLNKDQRLQEVVKDMKMTGFIQSLAEGIDTSIGKISKDSLDLSGGQWQRVAIARALMSQAPIRVLDEPTAALDPVSESQLYETVNKISRKKTTLLISHRLASTKSADTIYVIEDGTVREQGDFETLMQVQGLYATMFNSQKGWYEDEV